MFHTNGLDSLIIDLDELAEMPDDVIYDMLEAAGEIVVDAQKAQIDKMRLVDTGMLRDSIQVDHKRRHDKKDYHDTRYINVYPQGTRRTYVSRRKTGTYKTGARAGRTYRYGGKEKETTNAEIAFINEFGAPNKNILPSMWMQTANESCADEATEAEYVIYNKYLESKNL